MKKNIRTLLGIITLLLISINGYSFKWPIGRGSDEGPQHVTATFGEFRTGGGSGYFADDHFHAGVDIEALTFVSHVIYAVEYEQVWEINNTIYAKNVKTDWHDFRHVNFPVNVSVDDWVDSSDTLTENGYDGHLHFNSRESRTGPPTANNPLDPDYNILWRFDTLCTDYSPPRFNEILFVEDGNPNNVLDPNHIPEDTDVDIIVRAEVRTEYPGGVDDNNGVYKLMYGENFLTDTTIVFNKGISNWDIGMVYDTTRTDESNYYYVVTNEMHSNGYWNTGLQGSHWIYIRIEDEQGRFPQPETLIVVDVYSSGVADKQINNYFLTVKDPVRVKRSSEIKYGVPEKSKVKIGIYDSSGRLVKEVLNEEKNSGEYIAKWKGENKEGNRVPSGTYYCKMKACFVSAFVSQISLF